MSFVRRVFRDAPGRRMSAGGVVPPTIPPALNPQQKATSVEGGDTEGDERPVVRAGTGRADGYEALDGADGQDVGGVSTGAGCRTEGAADGVVGCAAFSGVGLTPVPSAHDLPHGVSPPGRSSGAGDGAPIPPSPAESFLAFHRNLPASFTDVAARLDQSRRLEYVRPPHPDEPLTGTRRPRVVPS